jgi:hypothetical protein
VVRFGAFHLGDGMVRAVLPASSTTGVVLINPLTTIVAVTAERHPTLPLSVVQARLFRLSRTYV